MVFTLLWSCDVTDKPQWPRQSDWQVLVLVFEDPPSFDQLGHRVSRSPDWNCIQIKSKEYFSFGLKK